MKKNYHHLANGTFRNPEGSKVIDMNFNWSFKVFNQEKKKLDMTFPESNIIKKEKVLSDLNNFQKEDYVAWIGHATFLLKLGEITIITDPVFSKNAGPLFFGPKRFTEPALKLNEIPRTDIFLLTHNHYDHQDMKTIMRFPYKESKVLVPLGLKKYFKINRFKDVNEMDWYDQIRINQNLNITFLPSVHWSKRSLTDTNKTLWGSYLIEYKGKKILFSCDTGVGKIYKELGDKYGPIDLTFINIGAYNFYPMASIKDSSAYHTNPEEALGLAKDLKSKKVIGMHWGTFVLSLEPILEPPLRFKQNAEKFGFEKDDAIIFKIGEFKLFKELFDTN
ncbi:MBL fold metallo-hydrolase [Candidatus Pelagibacter sp.]|nr:MBL fold metallo-hydrolase [Candidatus Pelagibacter sp.]